MSNIDLNWNKYPNFKAHEFNCKHTGRNEMQPEFMDWLQALRTKAGIPFVISSGYRDPTHPVEARKSAPGAHSRGIAVDILAPDGATAGRIIELAILAGVKGVGVAQDNRRNRQSRFVHLDLQHRGVDYPVFWSY